MHNIASTHSHSHQATHVMPLTDIAMVLDRNKVLEHRCGTLEAEVLQLKQQVAWFQKQIFGQKSERRMIESSGLQGTLGYDLDDITHGELTSKKHRVQSHDRESKRHKLNDEIDDLGGLFFDESKVPIETIILSNPDTTDLAPDEYEIIGEKVSYRLAQRSGSYVILKYIRPVIKRRDTQIISCPPSP